MFETFPKEFGSYQLLDKIGQGGMAEIFRAESNGPVGFAKEVAIKRILSSLASNEDFITQFLDEARIVGNLSHPNIVQIYDVGQVDDAYYIAMEFVNGKHLGQVIQRAIESMSQFPLHEAIAIITEVSKALAFAHSAVDSLGNPLHIIHRDVSPQNILVGLNGAVKLTDFGIAKAANKLFQTTAGVIKGKFSYLAPEQLVGKGASTASDIFSLGVAFWEMLSGRRLFQGESDIRTIQLVQACQVPSLSQFRSDIPPELEQVISYMLARDPEYRYQNAYDLVNALSHILMQHGVTEHLNLIANFMGSLYPESFQQNNGAAPTRASMPAVSEAEAAAYYPPKGPASPDEFNDAPTEAISESPLLEKYLPSSQGNEATSALKPLDDALDAPTEQLNQKEVEDFFATQQMDPLPPMTPPSAPAPSPPPPIEIPSIKIPSAVGEEKQLSLENDREPALKPTAPLRTPSDDEIDDAPTNPNMANMEPVRKSGVWRMFLWVFLFFGLLGGGLTFGYLQYEKQRTSPEQSFLAWLTSFWEQEPMVVEKNPNAPATILVQVQPPDAMVTLNGQPMNGKPKRQTGLISGIKYRIRVIHKDYLPEVRLVELKDGEIKTLTLQLKQKPASN